MKVCTDACVFGAWATPFFQGKENHYFLDIGAGTGLLSLMLAQRYTNAFTDAAEIDAGAALQAKENFDSSPWHTKLKVLPGDVQYIDGAKQYDFIICNPPFYEGNLKSPSGKRNTAMHSTQLTMQQLVYHINRLLLPGGSFALLIPYNRQKIVEALAKQYDFMPVNKTLVKQTPSHHYFRSMLLFKKNSTVCNEDEIIIKDPGGNYTAELKELLKEFYLIF